MARSKEQTPNCEASQTDFFYRQLFVTPLAVSSSRVNLSGKTAIVSGSNVGLGLEVCRQLIGLGLSRLIMAVRDETKGQAARSELVAEGRSVEIEVWKINLSSYDSIIAFADRCKSLPALNIVVLNAGVFKTSLELNAMTGHDEVVQVNYLSTVLLAIQLLPILQSKNTPQTPGHITIVSSDTSAWSKLKERKENPLLPAFDKPQYFEMQDRYATSKLLGQFFLTELAKRVPSSVAVVNSANPGLCHGSGLHRETHGGVPGTLFAGFKRMIGRPIAVGARVLTDAAVNHGDETHGKYLGDGKIKPMAPIIYTPEGEKLGKKLWDETMLELSFAKVRETISSLSK